MKTRWLMLLLAILLLATLTAQAEGVLKYGSTGETVTALQEKLTALGYYNFRITGKFQERTQAAIRAFQKDNGYRVTGEADEALVALILSDEALPKPTPTPRPTPAPEPTLAPPGEYARKLEYGSSGAEVRRVQMRLAELGYYTDTISNDFLGNTKNAVKAFQEKHALQVDGIVGVHTWNMLFFDDPLPASATPRPTPEPTPVPYRIGVDVTNQVITIYGLDEQGEHTQIVRRMICSTGTKYTPSPLGSFTLNGRTARWCYFDRWGTHAQYWTRITSSIAFHSVIYSEPDEMSLATSSYRKLGERASHGCIRLLVSEAKWIYQNCGVGTVVDIYEGASDPELTMSLKPPELDRRVMLPRPTPQPTPPPEYRADALPPTPFTTLEWGTESEAVYWLQCKLAEMGYYTGTITGGYYGGTVEAVKAFQQDAGLSVDGQAGPITQTALYADLLATPAPTSAPMPEYTLTPTPTPSPESTWLVVITTHAPD